MKLLTKYQSRITAKITATATSMILESVTGIPAVPFMGILDAGSTKEEAVLVTAVVTATKVATITRAQRGSTGVKHNKTALVYHGEVELSDLKQTETFSAAGHGLHLEHTFTLATVGALKSLQIEQVYQPSSGGYGSPVPIASKVSLGESAEYTGGQGGMYAVQAQLNFKDGAIVNQANSVFAGLRSVITTEGTPVFTAFDTLAGIYIDNLSSIDLAGIGVKEAALASFQNHGGTLDCGLHMRGNDKIDRIFSLDAFRGADPAVTGSGDTNFKLKIDIDGQEKYLIAYEP